MEERILVVDDVMPMSAVDWMHAGFPAGSVIFISSEQYPEELERIRERIMLQGGRRSARLDFVPVHLDLPPILKWRPTSDRPYQPNYEQHRPKQRNKKLRK